MTATHIPFPIRLASRADAETLAHIGVATFVETYTEIINGPAMMAHCTHQHSPAIYTGYLADPHAACWLAEYAETGAPIGYATLCPPDLPIPVQPGDLELKRIYLLSRFHGCGAGRALMDTAITAARKAGAPRLLLGTYEGNQRALAFYQRHGFEQVGTRQFNVGDQVYDDIILGITL